MLVALEIRAKSARCAAILSILTEDGERLLPKVARLIRQEPWSGLPQAAASTTFTVFCVMLGN